MIIHNGTQERFIAEITEGAGTTVKEGSIQTDSLLATLWVNSISSGSISVVVYTETEPGKADDIITFPTVNAPTTELLIRKSAVALQRFRVVVTYTGICDYEIYIRAIEGAGESSVRILGAPSFRVTQQDVTTTAIELIPASLDDRQGIIIKNWSISTNMYIAETMAKATIGDGYPVAPRDNVTLDVSAGVSVWAVAESGTVDVRIGES